MTKAKHITGDTFQLIFKVYERVVQKPNNSTRKKSNVGTTYQYFLENQEKIIQISILISAQVRLIQK